MTKSFAVTSLAKGLTMVLIGLVLAACSAGQPVAAPTAPLTVSATASPAFGPTVEPSCPGPAEGAQLLTNEPMGYCLLVPDDLFRVDPNPAEVCLVEELSAMACHSSGAMIAVADAGGRSNREFAEAVPEQIERTSVTVAGQEAILLPIVFGQGSTREVMFVYDDRLYTFQFNLPGPDDLAGNERLERLYDTVIGSFTLIPVNSSLAQTEAGTEPSGSAVIVVVKDGDIWVWEEATGVSRSVYGSGDVTQVELSDDSQLVAFVRRTRSIQDPQRWESAVWVVARDGENPRELVSDDELRTLLAQAGLDADPAPWLQWIPGSHRLLYNTNQIASRFEARGLYLIDVDTLSNAELAPPQERVVFAPSPDGEYIALMHWPELELPYFVNVDDSLSGPFDFIHPSGAVPSREAVAWTQDSTAVLVKDFVPSSGQTMIWLVPIDGSPSRPALTLRGDRDQLAPHGTAVTFVRGTGGFGPFQRFLAELSNGLGPLAVISDESELSWSPGGTPYVVDSERMSPLCAAAAQAIEICGPSIRFTQSIQSLEWIDRNRFVYLTYVPRRLMLGSLDGQTTLIAEDPQEPLSFAAVASTCTDSSEFVADVTVPDGTHLAPDSVFVKTWRVRNSGNCAWGDSYRLTFLSGDRMSGPRSAPLGEVVQPGEEVELTVLLIAPGTPGAYRGTWQLFAPDGSPFGTTPYVAIQTP